MTCAPVKVLVVDDDAVAHAGEVQAVSEAVGVAPGIHVCLAGGRQRRLWPEPGGKRQRNKQKLFLINSHIYGHMSHTRLHEL